MKLSLVVTSEGKGAGKVIPITLSQFLIGRDPQCHLRPVSPVISKRHCALLVKGGKVFIRDFDSTNGTFLNDRQVKGEVEMQDNDRLVIGPISFTVRIEAGAPATKPTPPPAPAADPAAAAKSPAAPAAKAPPAAAEDDESIAAMLLSLQDEGDSKPASPLANDAVPQGSTVMDIPSPLGKGDTKEEELTKPDPKKKEPPKSSGNTQTAAKAILEKYTRRQRST